MSDDSDESNASTSIPLVKPTSRDKTGTEIQTGSDDELYKLTTRKFREKIASESGSQWPDVEHVRRDFLALEEKKKNPLSQSMTENRPIGPYCKMKTWYSVDSGESDMLDKNRRNLPLGGSIKRKLRRKPTKRFDKIEETYGINTEEYEQIGSRVLQERAVVNAIEALQERWRMIMYMYHDCVDLNEGRKDRDQKRLTVKRQLELMFIVGVFVVMCIPITVILVMLCR